MSGTPALEFDVGRARAAVGLRAVSLLVQGVSSTALFFVLAALLPTGEFAPMSVALGALVTAQLLGDFGVSQATVTALPSMIAERPAERRDLIGSAARAVATAALAAVFVCLAVTLVVEPGARLPVALVAIPASLAVVVAGVDGILRAEGKNREAVALITLSRLGGLVAIPAAAITGEATDAAIALAAGSLVGSLPALRVLGASLTRVPPGLPSFWRATAPLGAGQLSLVLGTRLNTFVLGAGTSLRAAAAYESAWRLFQIGQYILGAVTSGLSPVLAQARGAGRVDDVRRLMRVTLASIVVAAVILGAALMAGRHVISDALFSPALAGQVASALMPFALVTPLAIVSLWAATFLSSDAADRRWVLGACVGGALLNVVAVLPAVAAWGAEGASVACALGLMLAMVVVLARYVRALAADRPSSEGWIEKADLGRSPIGARAQR